MAPNDTKRPQCGVLPKQEKSEKKDEQSRKDPELPHDYRLRSYEQFYIKINRFYCQPQLTSIFLELYQDFGGLLGQGDLVA